MILKHNCSKCFHSLGIPTKMKIFKFLSEKGRSSVNDIVSVVSITQPTVSYHLKEMQDSGLLKNKKIGKEVYYYVDPRCSECFFKHA